MNNSLTQSTLAEDTKQWIQIDSQLKIMNEQQRQLRQQKTALSHRICSNMDNINSHKMSMANIVIKKYEKKDYSPLTFQYIEECLHKIIKNENHVGAIITKLKDDRQIKRTADIKIV
jgi:hypothetical protein